MKITVEFESIEEFEAFRTSGKKTRGKGQVDAEESAGAAPAVAPPAPPAAAPTPPMQGFPLAQQQQPAPAPIQQVHPLAAAITAKMDGAVASGQPADAIVTWFRSQIGPDAANATFDQLKQVFIPRMQEAQLRQIAPQLGIAV